MGRRSRKGNRRGSGLYQRPTVETGSVIRVYCSDVENEALKGLNTYNQISSAIGISNSNAKIRLLAVGLQVPSKSWHAASGTVLGTNIEYGIACELNNGTTYTVHTGKPARIKVNHIDYPFSSLSSNTVLFNITDTVGDWDGSPDQPNTYPIRPLFVDVMITL